MALLTTGADDLTVVGPRLAVAGRRVLNSRTGAWDQARAVLIEDGRIVGVTSMPPTDWPVIELPDASLLPGFIDAHTHVLLRSTLDQLDLARQLIEENPGRRIAGAVQAMSIALRHGFTTIRDLGTEGAGYADVGLRDAARDGVVPGPRMLVAGPAIRSTGRYPIRGERHGLTFPVGVDSCAGPDACREVVRTQAAYGIDCLKIYVSGRVDPPADESGYPDGPLVWTEAELQALVDEARRQGLRVAAHAQSLSGTAMAISAGVDSIEHGYAISPALATEMADRGVYLVPTLLMAREAAQRGWYVHESVRRAHERSFQNCLEAGVLIAFGTDVGGFEWTRLSQAEEFELMVGLGMSGACAVQAATVRAAELLGLTGVAGTLEPGASADLVAVAGDPLGDIGSTQRIELVVQQGRVVSHGHPGSADGCAS